MTVGKPGVPVSPDELSALGELHAFKTRAKALQYLAGEIDGQQQCLICFRFFTSLGNHVARGHGVSAREYKRAFNLPRKCALMSRKLVEHHRDLNLNNPKVMEHAIALGHVYGPDNGRNHTMPDFAVWQDCNKNGHPRQPDELSRMGQQSRQPRVNSLIPPPVNTPEPGFLQHMKQVMLDLVDKKPNVIKEEEKKLPPPAPAPGYDPLTAMARIERLEKAVTVLIHHILNAGEQALTELIGAGK